MGRRCGGLTSDGAHLWIMEHAVKGVPAIRRRRWLHKPQRLPCAARITHLLGRDGGVPSAILKGDLLHSAINLERSESSFRLSFVQIADFCHCL
jgi:hypothetical protein